VRRSEEAQYRDFVVARLDRLRRTAYLLCRNWHTADDLVSITLTKLYRNWRRANEAANLDAYVRGILANAWVDESRRSWRREDSTADLPEIRLPSPSSDALSDRTALAKLLTELPGRQRAVIVLRFYCDMSVAETADLLGVSEGTVKSQSARGLELLRAAAHHHALGEDS
jgi:RNA polymerase sigma-70 factor (sigma-E family)